MKFHRILVSSVSLALAVFTTASCGQSGQDSSAKNPKETHVAANTNPVSSGSGVTSSGPHTVRIPADTVMYVTIHGDSKFRFWKPNGERAQSCELCKDVKRCKDPSLKQKFCQGTIDTSIKNIQQLSIVTHLGSNCTTASGGGGHGVSCFGCPLPDGHVFSHLCE